MYKWAGDLRVLCAQHSAINNLEHTSFFQYSYFCHDSIKVCGKTAGGANAAASHVNLHTYMWQYVCVCTDFLCFFSRSWLRLCWPSRWSLVSCSSAVARWAFFFSCWMFLWYSSLSACRSLICTNAHLQLIRRVARPVAENCQGHEINKAMQCVTTWAQET